MVHLQGQGIRFTFPEHRATGFIIEGEGDSSGMGDQWCKPRLDCESRILPQSPEAHEMRNTSLKREKSSSERREALNQGVSPLLVPGHLSASSELSPVLIAAQEGRGLTMLGA